MSLGNKQGIYDVLVVGAGAAGMLSAGKAAQAGAKTLLLEKNEKVGRKIGITGKGRCNVTNLSELPEIIENIVTNDRFCYGALSRFLPRDLMELLENQGLKLKVERGNRVFPVSDKAFDVIDALRRYVTRCGAQLKTGEPMRSLKQNENGLWQVETSRDSYLAKSVVLATGGLSYTSTGSTGDGYVAAKKLGLTVTDLRPSLIPLCLKEDFCRDLMGLSLRNVRIRITQESPGETSKLVTEQFGEMLFTHFGVSGPIILTAASYLQAYCRKKHMSCEAGNFVLHVDLKSALSEETLDRRIQRDFEKYHGRYLAGALEDLLPKRLTGMMARILLGKGASAKRAGELSREERLKLVQLLKDWRFHIVGTRPLEEAIVTMGGVDVHEVAPSTMMVKNRPGLFIAGELLDVDALTGGFNLQLAFATGAAAGQGAAVYARR